MKDHEPLQSGVAKKKGAARRLLAGLGVAFALVILGMALNAFWITPGERSAAGLALTMIDEMQEMPSFGDADVRVISEIEQPAREALKNAQQAVWTHRDVRISWQLQTYFLEVEQELGARQLTGIVPEGNAPSHSTEKCGAARTDEARTVCLALHKALD
jgi:hypothetical protein